MKSLKQTLLVAAALASFVPAIASAKVYGESETTNEKLKAKATPTDCYGTVEGLTSSTVKGKKVIVNCNDGDACDQDGIADGKCTFGIIVCAHDELEGCTAPDVTAISLKSKSIASPLLPTLPATASACGDPNVVTVAAPTGKQKKSKPLNLVMKTTSAATDKKLKTDIDKISINCLAPTPKCNDNPAGGPKELRFRIGAPGESGWALGEGNDLDIGWTGSSHNQLSVAGGVFRVCLKDCDAAGSTACTEDEAQTQAANGQHFGAPLPLITGATATCVDNVYAATKIANAQANLQTGQMNADISLIARTFLTDPTNICPRCVVNGTPALGSVGKCDSTSRTPNAACTVEGLVPANNSTYAVSTTCLPPEGKLIGEISIPLNLTTESSSLDFNSSSCPNQTRNNNCGNNADGACTTTNCPQVPNKGPVQFCCDSNTAKSCFPTEATNPSRVINLTGAKTVPQTVAGATDFPKEHQQLLVSAFCIAATTNPAVNAVAGLPGPGTNQLPVNACWLSQDTDVTSCANK